jgi:hypothetical protein
VWFKAPDEGQDITDALVRFALTLEDRLPGLHLVDLLDNPRQLAGFLPALTALLARKRVLIVVDNAESLLTVTGQWRDPRWGQLVGALTDHGGLGRMVVTTRRVPAVLNPRMLVLPVDALSADESLLLARSTGPSSGAARRGGRHFGVATPQL